MNEDELRREFGESQVVEDIKIPPEKKKESGFWNWCKNYGWALLVVILAIGVLWYFGVFPNQLFPQSNSTTINSTNSVVTILPNVTLTPILTKETCKCGPCNATISLSNLTKEGYRNLTCCVKATWNETTDKCDIRYQTTKIMLPKKTNTTG